MRKFISAESCQTAKVLTFGHGRLLHPELEELLTDAGVESVIDVRRFPGSRANPAAARGEIEKITASVGIGYRHDERLGGRRRLSAAEDADSPDSWWRVAAFRAYAAWTRTEEFSAALDDLLTEAKAQRTAIMCSEAVWWRCHRRVISDVLVLAHSVPVQHLMHDGRLVEHPVSDGARLEDGAREDGALKGGARLVWDVTPDAEWRPGQ